MMKQFFWGVTLVLWGAAIVTACSNRPKGASAEGGVAYSNPLPVAFGDPFILSASDGKYYMYGTGGVERGFGAYSSDNLGDWQIGRAHV